MIEHSPPWTTNLDQLAWSVGELAVILGVIWFAVQYARGSL
jgi:hypothetical protein